MDEFARTRMLLGAEGMERLSRSRVAVFGLGGVGSWAMEALVRSGVGALDLIDGDRVSPTNINRQLIALHSTLGMPKTEAAALRAADINPAVKLRCFDVYYSEKNADGFDLAGYDYIVDAIDMVSAKLELVCRAQALGVPIISSLGTGNKLDPSRLRISDLSETLVCPLARVMRKELRRRGVEHLKVLWSDEEPAEARECGETRGRDERPVPGSVAFVPPVAGLMIAGEAVRYLAGV